MKTEQKTKKTKLLISLSPEMDQLINKCVAEKVRRNGKFMSRQEFLIAELKVYLVSLLKRWEVFADESSK